MHLNFKNVLAGVGGLSVIFLIIAVGVFSKAGGLLDSKRIDPIDGTTQRGATECPFTNYAISSNYNIPEIDLPPYGSTIFLDSKGGLYNFFAGEKDIFQFDKATGRQIQINQTSKPIVFNKTALRGNADTALPSLYIDENRKILYASSLDSTGRAGRLNFFDLEGNLIDPKYLDDVQSSAVDGFGDKIFILPLQTTQPLDGKNTLKLRKYIVSVLDKDADEKPTKISFSLSQYKTLPYFFNHHASAYPDMDIANESIIYIPMNIENAIFELNTKTGKYDILAGYDYVSTILRYDAGTLEMIDADIADSPFYKKQEKKEFKNGAWQKFTEVEKEQIFSRIAIDKNGNLNLLMKNTKDLDANGYSRQNLFRQYDKNGNLLKEWSSPGLNFFDLDVDAEGNIFSVTKDKVYKYSPVCMGKLIIKKIEEPNTGRDFNFSLVNPNNYINGTLDTFRLKNNQTKEYIIKEGNYNIREEDLDQDGYITSIKCLVDAKTDFNPFVSIRAVLKGGEPTGENTSSEVQVNLKTDSVITCIFTNFKKPGLVPDREY